MTADVNPIVILLSSELVLLCLLLVLGNATAERGSRKIHGSAAIIQPTKFIEFVSPPELGSMAETDDSAVGEDDHNKYADAVQSSDIELDDQKVRLTIPTHCSGASHG